MRFTEPPSDQQIFAVVEAWIDDLSREDYDRAYARTAHDSYYEWTPELIRSVIEGYGLPEPHRSGVVFKVTDPNTAKGKPYHREIERNDVHDSVIAEAWYDLPLNGKWSDLTATFSVRLVEGAPTLILEQIHVF